MQLQHVLWSNPLQNNNDYDDSSDSSDEDEEDGHEENSPAMAEVPTSDLSAMVARLAEAMKTAALFCVDERFDIVVKVLRT